jgi:hypothetical protein
LPFGSRGGVVSGSVVVKGLCLMVSIKPVQVSFLNFVWFVSSVTLSRTFLFCFIPDLIESLRWFGFVRLEKAFCACCDLS